MPEKPGLRILLACGRPLVLKVEQWIATLDEEAQPHLRAAKDKLKEIADPGKMTAHGKMLIFDLYPPAPDGDFLKDALKSVIPLKDLSGKLELSAIDAVRPGEDHELLELAHVFNLALDPDELLLGADANRPGRDVAMAHADGPHHVERGQAVAVQA